MTTYRRYKTPLIQKLKFVCVQLLIVTRHGTYVQHTGTSMAKMITPKTLKKIQSLYFVPLWSYCKGSLHQNNKVLILAIHHHHRGYHQINMTNIHVRNPLFVEHVKLMLGSQQNWCCAVFSRNTFMYYWHPLQVHCTSITGHRQTEHENPYASPAI